MGTAAASYVIGDVHGREDLLLEALAFARSDAEARGVRPEVKFLGDLVDRGPSSRACVDLVIETLRDLPGSVFHCGNHDDWFLSAASSMKAREEIGPSWMIHGGQATLRSYSPNPSPDAAIDEAYRLFPHHFELIRSAPFLTLDGPFALVHAGISPSRPISEQDRDVCMWIRDGFMEHLGPLERPVIHGHTIVGKLPQVTENRISIDTGAYSSGRLTVLVIDHAARDLEFHQATELGMERVEPVRIDRGLGTLLDDVQSLFMPGRPAPLKWSIVGWRPVPPPSTDGGPSL